MELVSRGAGVAFIVIPNLGIIVPILGMSMSGFASMASPSCSIGSCRNESVRRKRLPVPQHLADFDESLHQELFVGINARTGKFN